MSWSIAMLRALGRFGGGGIPDYPAGEVLILDSKLGYTLVGGYVSLFEDQVGTVDVAQAATPGYRPYYNPANPVLNNYPSLDPDVDDRMDSSGQKANPVLKALHNGTTVTIYFVADLHFPAVNQKTIFQTAVRAVTVHGIWVGTYGPDKLLVTVTVGSGVDWQWQFYMPMPVGEAAYVVKLGTALSPNGSLYRNGKLIYSANFKYAPTTNDCFSEFSLFYIGGISPFSMLRVWQGDKDVNAIQAAHEDPSRYGPCLLDYGIGTFSRASVATFWDVDDVNGDGPLLYKYAVNVPRLLRDGSYVCEGSRTNDINNSEDVTVGGQWVATGGGVIIPPLETAPDGAVTAQHLRVVSNYTPYAALPIAVRTYSQFVRAITGAGSSTALIALQDTAAGTGSWFEGLVSEAWERIKLTSAAGQYAVSLDGRSPPASAPLTMDTYAFGHQSESPASFSTEYIKTTGVPATRAIDLMSISVGYWPEVMRTGKYQFDVWPEPTSGNDGLPGRQMVFSSPVVAGLGGFLALEARGATGQLCYFTAVVGGVIVGGYPPGYVTFTYSPGQKLTITVDLTAGDITIAGATTGNGTIHYGFTNSTWPDGILSVGHRSSAAPLYGRMSRPRLVP